MNIHRTIILNVLCGYETWSLTAREFENRVLRRTCGLKRQEVTGEWRNSLIRTFLMCTVHQILLR
jgi:hypothetical protein